MSTAEQKLSWESTAKAKYEDLIKRIPMFHRDIAKQVVDKQAVINAQERGANEVSEEDIVSAFFSGVPKTFYSLMIRLFDDVGFDYKKYEGK